MSERNEGKQTTKRINMLTATAVMTAVICILAPMSIPIGPVPISLTNLAIFIALYILGWKMGTVSLILYIALGAIGLPVFSGFTGGLAKFLGPTGGYIVGFIPMAVIAGLIIEKNSNRIVQFVGNIAATAVLYAIGTAWFCFLMKSDVAAALSACVIPFIPGDVIKIVIAMVFGPMIKKRLSKANVLPY